MEGKIINVAVPVIAAGIAALIAAIEVYRKRERSKDKIGQCRPNNNNNNSAPPQATPNSGNNSNTGSKRKSRRANNQRNVYSISPNTNSKRQNQSSGSGNDPPRQNIKNEHPTDPTTNFAEFLIWLKSLFEKFRTESPILYYNCLKQFGSILNMFDLIEDYQQKSLMRLIRRLQKNRCLAPVIKISLLFLFQNFESINFTNFLSFVEFVAAYILEQAANENSLNTQSTQSLDKRLSIIIEEIANNQQTIDDGSSQGPANFEEYYDAYKRRFRTVIKVQNGKIILSSAYFVDEEFEGDKYGDFFINGKRVS